MLDAIGLAYRKLKTTNWMHHEPLIAVPLNWEMRLPLRSTKVAFALILWSSVTLMLQYSHVYVSSQLGWSDEWLTSCVRFSVIRRKSPVILKAKLLVRKQNNNCYLQFAIRQTYAAVSTLFIRFYRGEGSMRRQAMSLWIAVCGLRRRRNGPLSVPIRWQL
jgi:hypothetical protein